MEEIRYPKPSDMLIGERGDKVLYADWMIGKWDLYADAYKEAADMLVDQIQENWAHDDRFILPIVFMYRHFVELKLKWIIIHLDQFSGTNIPRGLFKNHRLPGLWDYVKSHLKCLRGGELGKDIQTTIGKLIRELSDLDPESMCFRYSHDLNLNEMPLPKFVSMENFKNTMDILANGLGLIESGIEVEKEGRALDAELYAEMIGYMEDYY